MKRPKMTNIIYLTAIWISILCLVLRWHRLDNYEKKLERLDNLRQEIQFDINQLAEKREEVRLKKIDLMADYFNSEYRLSSKTDYPIEQMLDLEIFMQSKMWMPYKLWWKGWWQIDCSWLFGTYAHYKKKLISYNDLINHYNAEIIRQLNVKKDIKDIQRWDLLYIIKENKAIHIMYVYAIDLWNITTIEANANSWVSYQEYRFIKWTEWIFLEQDWKVWDFDITHNSLIDMELIWDFLISSYIPTTQWMNINNGWKSWNHTASWLPLNDSYAWKIAACPKQYSIWLNWEPKQKLYIEDYGIVECSDRGGLIVMKWETNSRGNISSMNRLDLFAWLNTPKIKRSQTTRKVYLVK